MEDRAEDADCRSRFGESSDWQITLLASGRRSSNMKKLMFVLFAFALLASTVSLAQDAANPATARVAAQAQVEKASSKEPIGNLSVTDVKMISETCAK